jgi:hypothetical protein
MGHNKVKLFLLSHNARRKVDEFRSLASTLRFSCVIHSINERAITFDRSAALFATHFKKPTTAVD